MINKIKDDPKLIGIILVGVFLIGFLAYNLLGEFEDDKLVDVENKTGVNDILVPKDDKTVNNDNKIETYEDYRKNNQDKNVDYNTEDLFVFSEDEDSDESDKGIDQQITERTQTLKDKYRQITKTKDVEKDFYRTTTPRINTNTKNSNAPAAVPSAQSQTPEIVDTKRRKGVTDSGGNMTMTKKSSGSNSYTIKAYIFNRSRLVKNGSTIRLMIDEPIKISSQISIPKNTILTGKAEFGQERIMITIRSIQFDNQIHTIDLIAFGIDGQLGIYSESIIAHDIAQESIAGAIDQGNTKVNIPVLGEVSVDLAKAKLKDQSVVVPDGTAIILKSK
ncbi:MAG: conjugative transposon protein TraM [Saprospiraceae bacterium]